MRTIRNFLILIMSLAIIAMLVYQYRESRFPEIEGVRESEPITGLHPIVKEKRDQLIEAAAKKGIRVVITQDFRSAADQDALYAKGRTVPGEIVTNAQGGESYHNYGLAIDFALLAVNGQIIWDMHYDGNGNGQSDWREVVAIAKDLGFTWGGDWRNFKDYPHLQMDFGLSIWELQMGKRPPE